jgi:hypothetical protein
VELLNSGVDTLYWSARGEAAELIVELAEYQAGARRDHSAVAWREIDGYSLSVEPGGGHGYSVIVKCAEFSVYLTPYKSRPTFWVQLGSRFIHSIGIRPAIDASVGVVGQLSSSALREVGVSRIDPFADVGGWSFGNAEADQIRTRVRDVESHFIPRSGHLHSVMIGTNPLGLRIYDKRYQIAVEGGFADQFWNGYLGPVTRVEFEFWTKRLKAFGVRSFDEVLGSIGDLWRYGTSTFVELRVPSERPEASWPLSPAWDFVQRVAEWKFPTSGVIPLRAVMGDRITLLRALYGYLTSFAAVEGMSSEREALWRLEECLPEVARDRDFVNEIARKAARLPKAYRERQGA